LGDADKRGRAAHAARIRLGEGDRVHAGELQRGNRPPTSSTATMSQISVPAPTPHTPERRGGKRVDGQGARKPNRAGGLRPPSS
jgi:hypothetical protein